MTTATSTSAPGSLETVRRFVNTLDVEASSDSLSSPDALARWLREAGLIGGALDASDDDLQRAVALREALREVMAAHHSDAPIPNQVLTVVNSAADRADLGLALTPEGGWAARSRASGVDGALGALMTAIVDAAADGRWQRLKVCTNDACRWAFYDHSRARTGKWCSMRVCGNRAKQQAWRERHDHQPPVG
jgi:predicted RNA-binding Zn ribbon-like protein